MNITLLRYNKIPITTNNCSVSIALGYHGKPVGVLQACGLHPYQAGQYTE